MLGTVAARIQHDIVAFWCQRAVRFPSQPCVANSLTRLQLEIAEAEFAVALGPIHALESSDTVSNTDTMTRPEKPFSPRVRRIQPAVAVAAEARQRPQLLLPT
jgi:hypothetical protein